MRIVLLVEGAIDGFFLSSEFEFKVSRRVELGGRDVLLVAVVDLLRIEEVVTVVKFFNLHKQRVIYLELSQAIQMINNRINNKREYLRLRTSRIRAVSNTVPAYSNFDLQSQSQAFTHHQILQNKLNYLKTKEKFLRKRWLDSVKRINAQIQSKNKIIESLQKKALLIVYQRQYLIQMIRQQVVIRTE